MTDDQKAPTERLTALVSGKVQGVGYRLWVQRHARDLDIRGSAENLLDGRVEVIAEGSSQALGELLRLLKKGPAHARVTDLEVRFEEKAGLPSGFYTY